MKLGALFLVLGGTLLYLGLRHPVAPLRYLLLSAGVAFLLLGIAYFSSWPGLLGKKRTGHLLPSSYLLFWPYHLLNFLSLASWRVLRREPPFHEIVPGLYLGGRLLPWEHADLKALGNCAVLDLTCEFSEVDSLRRQPGYRCLPMLDSSAPSQEQLEAGVRFIQEQLSKGPVFVHCALGHGRSATFVVAYLLASGRTKSLRQALDFVRSKRPLIRLLPGQLKSLKHYPHE